MCSCLGSCSSTEEKQSIQAGDATGEEAAGVSSVLGLTDKQWLTGAGESIAGVVELKEKQCESNLTGLLITRLIFQTLCMVTGWRGEEFLQEQKSLLLRAVCSLLQDVGRVQDATGLLGAKEILI